ncbi:hypothetical protein L226DRAFT_474384, partial [Lentinus tigrinus ALCF2SS1-7]|uniref:uncharacterized protein n=1 Tax=Lentinus tigrinus ALCF2SS1-7 TaxID=1328758 RepID=UPI0011663868
TAPVVCKAHEAKVASRAMFDQMVITSPNMDYIPAYPVETQVIHTHRDGMWGLHEYSRLPQRLYPGRWHVACIPIAASLPEIPSVLFTAIQEAQDWQEDLDIGFSGLGYICEQLRCPLESAALHAIRRFETINPPEDVRKYGAMLVMILRQVVDRMRYLPAAPNVAIAVAAHVQRICLELAGLITYINVVAPRLASADDYSMQVLPVVGAIVAEASDAQNAMRVGLPTWFLQPLTHDLPVWSVVESRERPLYMSGQLMHPPMLQEAPALVGVGNLTGNWQESMLLKVSKQVAGTHLASLSLAQVPVVPEPQPVVKRPRLHDEDMHATHFGMRPGQSVVVEPAVKGRRRRRHRGKGGSGPKPANPPERQTGPDSPHPSKSVIHSPFYDLAPAWQAALAASSPVPEALSSAKYFYPPPFLLDTVSSVAPLPQGCKDPQWSRSDEKISRYLHNLLRIRRFVRARIFDPSLSHEPLSIAEWRAALWGDYEIKTHPPRPSGAPANLKRAQLRQGQRNGVSRLCSRVGMLRSYREDEPVSWGAERLEMRQIATNTSLRRRLLWESHEINFRAEVMALDTLLVHQPGWLEIHRWQREAIVSGIWGAPTSAITVLPAEDEPPGAFRWAGGSQSELSLHTLTSFASVLADWPECPADIVRARGGDVNVSDMDRLQALTIGFYVRTFVTHYCRLPVPPIEFVADSEM